MRFSVLHISDLHRAPNNGVDNPWLLESLVRDFEQYHEQHPEIVRPTLCIVSGDLVFGINQRTEEAFEDLRRQYSQAEQFLAGLADRLFDRNRARIVILPGNHDVCYGDVIENLQKIEIPSDQRKKEALVAELFKPGSRLRWSWRDLCFFKIIDDERYCSRLRYFANTYESFYEGRRTFSLVPEQQYSMFDFPDLCFSVLALSSCHNNDPMRRAGAFHPTALAEACRALRNSERSGYLIAAAWHHNLVGGPAQDNRLDAGFIQLLIDAGVSLGFHGHQHIPECFDERYRLGPNPRKMTIVSAGTLCADTRNLEPGVPRSYNVIELDTDGWNGRVHQRHMVNALFDLPVWGPGHFDITNNSFVDFELCKPLATRSPQLDVQLALGRAEKLLGSHRWREAVDILSNMKDIPLARPLLVKALGEQGDARCTIATLWPPLTGAEAVIVGGAILDDGTRDDADAFLRLDLVSGSTDASVRDIVRRIHERRLR